MSQFNLFAPFAKCSSEEVMEFRGGDFLESLLLYEQVAVESTHYLDFLHLARRFGPEVIRRLLSEGIVVPYLSRGALGEAGRVAPLRAPQGRPLLPLMSYYFVEMAPRNHDGFLEATFARQEWLGDAERSQLLGLLADKRRLRDEEVIRRTDAAWRRLVSGGSTVVPQALSDILLERGLPPLRAEAIRFRCEFADEHDIRVETNLGEIIRGLSIEDQHQIVQSALFMVRGAAETIVTANHLSCIPAWSENLRFVGRSAVAEGGRMAREPHELGSRLARVLTIRNLPNLQSLFDDQDFRLERLLEVRNSRECREFRVWLRGLDQIDADQISDASQSLGQSVHAIRHSIPGKVAAVLWTVGGFVPVLGQVQGAISVVESIRAECDREFDLPERGALAFLNGGLAKLFTVVE